MAERKTYDWEGIEADYRAGQISVREIGRRYDISDKAIRNKAKANGWKRDLTSAVKKEVLSKLVRTKSAPNEDDADIIERASDEILEVIKCHRKAIEEQKRILNDIVKKLDSEMKADHVEGKGSRTITTYSASVILKSCSQILTNLIKLERQLYNLDSEGVSLENVLAGLPSDFAREVRSALSDIVSGKGR